MRVAYGVTIAVTSGIGREALVPGENRLYMYLVELHIQQILPFGNGSTNHRLPDKRHLAFWWANPKV